MLVERRDKNCLKFGCKCYGGLNSITFYNIGRGRADIVTSYQCGNCDGVFTKENVKTLKKWLDRNFS